MTNKTIKELKKQAADILGKLAPAIEEIFDGIPITVHYRIKTEESIIKKCNRKNLPPEELTDILGIRLIGGTKHFVEILKRIFNNFNIKEVEDYWYHTTDLGYRSIHILIEIEDQIVELQVHTALSSAFALLCHDFYKNHKEKKVVKETILLLREYLDGEAKKVNDNHKALVFN